VINTFDSLAKPYSLLTMNETIYTTNFNYFLNEIEFSLIIQLTTKEINIFDIELKYMLSFALDAIPIKYIFRKRNNLNELFIYNSDNKLIKYDLNNIGNAKSYFL